MENVQNTRLGLVMKMAETIADGLNHALWKYNRYEKDWQTPAGQLLMKKWVVVYGILIKYKISMWR